MHSHRFQPIAFTAKHSLCSQRNCNPAAQRLLSSAAAASSPTNDSITSALPARWLTDLKRRIGKCISFGLQREQVEEAGNILRAVARDWRELVAGSEGYLTGRGRAGFEGREVVWGEMVRILSHGFHSRACLEWFWLSVAPLGDF